MQITAYATIRYVKAGGAGTQTGESWANASGDLQLMINESSAVAIDTIWVAAGTYLPARPAYDPATVDSSNRYNAFTFVKNVRVYGGFPATGDPGWNLRNSTNHVTTLSGNIGLPDNADNCYHVLITAGANITADFVMDGFTVREGNGGLTGNISVNGRLVTGRAGAGWHNNGGSPVLRNMIFENNVLSDGTGTGVASFNLGGSPRIINAVFRNNVGMASLGGGGFNQSGNPVLSNVLIHGNATSHGAGWSSDGGNIVFNNVIIAGNVAPLGGAYCGRFFAAATFNNTIIFHNSAPAFFLEGVPLLPPPSVTFNYSLVQDIAGGANGNLDGTTLTPGFANPLTTAPTASGDYRLTAGSPCIDAGSDALIGPGVVSDLDGLLRVAGNAVDMGAYEFGSVLPVTLVSFSAKAVSENSVEIKWQTAQESRNDRFVVERSKDLILFETVAEIRDVVGNSNTLHTYRTIDPAPYAGTSYYRLLQYDTDGTRTSSRVVAVVVRSQGYAVFPNPVSGGAFRLGLDEPDAAEIEMHHAAGTPIRFTRRRADGQTVVITPVQPLAAGAYVVTVQERATRRRFHLVVR